MANPYAGLLYKKVSDISEDHWRTGWISNHCGGLKLALLRPPSGLRQLAAGDERWLVTRFRLRSIYWPGRLDAQSTQQVHEENDQHDGSQSHSRSATRSPT